MPGRGSTFLVLLPVAAPEAVAEERSGGGEARATTPVPPVRVLIVDDDDRVRRAAASILAECHRVGTASSGAEALAGAGGEEPPMLLLTAVVMADMIGPELARRLRERLPALRVLFMSSHAEDEISVRGVLAEGVHFIAKPLEREPLLDKVAAVLAGQAPGELGPQRARSAPATPPAMRT